MRKRHINPVPEPVSAVDMQLFDIPKVAELLSLGRTKIYDLINTGELQSIKIGSATRIPATAIKKFIGAKQDQAS